MWRREPGSGPSLSVPLHGPYVLQAYRLELDSFLPSCTPLLAGRGSGSAVVRFRTALLCPCAAVVHVT